MAATYEHKTRGYQVIYKVYLPDGTSVTKYRFRGTKTEAQELLRSCETIERGSRRGDLSHREIVGARHENIISKAEADLLSGGKSSEPLNLRRIYKRFKAASKVANTPYGHVVNIQRMRQWLRWLKNHPLQTLTAGTLKEDYVLPRQSGELSFTNCVTGYGRKGVQPKTIRNEIEILRLFIDGAVSLGMLEKNVAREVDIPVKNKKLRRALTPDELKAIIGTAKANHHLCHGYAYEMIMTYLYTGMRRSELSYLEWVDYHPEILKIYVQAKEIDARTFFTTKNGDAQAIEIPEKVCEILDSLERKGRFIFGGDIPIPPNRFYKTFKEIVQRAGIDPKLTLHHTRHHYCAELLRLTQDLHYVKDQARHKTIETTKNYVHTIQNSNSPIRKLNYGEDDIDI